MAKVSVTIPTYNRGSLVVEAIDSVLRQTVDDVEVIVIDDGSTDDTRRIVEGIGDCRVRYFYQDNRGCAGARNAGLAHCKADYIGFLDSDDIWPEDFLEVMLSRLGSNSDAGCVYCPVVKVDSRGERKPSYGAADCMSGWITRDLFKRSFIWLQATLFRAEALDGISFDESMRNGADTDAILRLSTRIRFLYVPEIEVVFRTQHGVAPRTDVSSLNCNRIRVLERFYYRLGGDRFVSRSGARRKLSHACRAVARSHYRCQSRSASIALYKKAISYLPTDVRLYWELFRAYRMDRQEDAVAQWEMPEPLGDIDY